MKRASVGAVVISFAGLWEFQVRWGESTGGDSKSRLRSRAMAWGWTAHRELLARCGLCTAAGTERALVFDSDDLKLSSRQGGDRATLLAACLSKAQGPKSDAATASGRSGLSGPVEIASQAILGHKLAEVQMPGSAQAENGGSHEGRAAVRVNVVKTSTVQRAAPRAVGERRVTRALVICSFWASRGVRQGNGCLACLLSTKHRLNTSLLPPADMCGLLCVNLQRSERLDPSHLSLTRNALRAIARKSIQRSRDSLKSLRATTSYGPTSDLASPQATTWVGFGRRPSRTASHWQRRI